MNFDWQTPLVLVVTALAAGWLVARAWRKRRRATAGGCGSAGEGCACGELKKTWSRRND
jgi:hypothetical protein